MTVLVVLRGGDFRRTFIWNDSTGTPMDVTDFTASFTVKRLGTTITEATEIDGITITEAEGKFAVHVEETAADDWATRDHWSLIVSSPDGEVTPLAWGPVAVVIPDE